MGRGKKLNKSKIQNQSEEGNLVKNIRNTFRNLKKESRVIKDRIIWDIALLQKDDDYYKPIGVGNF